MEIAASGFSQARKADHSLVTTADHRSDQFILQGLRQAFPQDGILTEESGAVGPTGVEYVWVVDPLDGTRAFVQQTPGFSVMIGLLLVQRPVLGVVYDPHSGWLYHAVAGCGAQGLPPGKQTPGPLRVSTCSDPKQMRLICSPGIPAAWRAAFIDRIGLQPGPTIHSVGVKVGLLTRQEGEVYFNHHSVSYWDTAAPILIAREAGATATMLDGSPFGYTLRSPPFQHHGPSLITNGMQHGEILAQVANIVANN